MNGVNRLGGTAPYFARLEHSVTGRNHFHWPVKHILLAQGAAVLLMAAVWIWRDWVAALSALTGGVIFVAANVYAAWRVFSAARDKTEDRSGHYVLSNLYRAELGKLVMIAALFVAVFAGWKTVNISAFIAGCAAAMIVGIIGAAFQRTDNNIPLKMDMGKMGVGKTDTGKRDTGTKTDG